MIHIAPRPQNRATFFSLSPTLLYLFSTYALHALDGWRHGGASVDNISYPLLGVHDDVLCRRNQFSPSGATENSGAVKRSFPVVYDQFSSHTCQHTPTTFQSNLLSFGMQARACLRHTSVLSINYFLVFFARGFAAAPPFLELAGDARDFPCIN